jgi:pimeloyl-ACP methyl ester carboxylesterase
MYRRHRTKKSEVASQPVAGASNSRNAARGAGRSRDATVMALSLLGGLAAAAALVTLVFAGDREHAITGAILLGFGFGWALLAVLSSRLTDRPQRWAAVPASAMALTGTALIAFAPDDSTLTALGWVWPPALLALVVWMTAQARRRLPGRSRPLMLYPVFAVLALVSLGGGYETLGNATESTLDPAGHRLIDVGGHRLDITCIGSGSPTVVLEPGLGESATAMARWIAPAVAPTTRICAYDQAGHGRSDAAPEGQTDAARDLDVLMQRVGIPGPYVIAGHSMGGLFALDYVQRFPEEVAGVVLIDSMHPRQTNAFAGTDRLTALVPTLARTGLARLFFDEKDGKPVAQARQLARDVADMPAVMNQAAQLKSLGDRPLAIVTAGGEYPAGWLEQQGRLAALSSNTNHQIVAGSTHDSLTGDQIDAAKSAQAIRTIVGEVRGVGGQ